MNRVVAFWRSTIGKKVVMGVTGVIGIGFVTVHALGNLLVFRGPAAMNAYSAFLKSTGELLWLARGVLIVALLLHVLAAYQLTMLSRAARPVGYVKRESQVSPIASGFMRVGGVILLLFVIFHILHFTTGTIRPAGIFSRTDVYSNVIAGFQVWWVALFYIIAMAALGAHLYHGAWSWLRTLGVSSESARPLHRGGAAALAIAVWLAFTSIPLAVWAGWVS